METFIVRLWTPSPELLDEVSTRELRGNVEHVPSKQSEHFRTSDELLAILRAVLEPGGPPADPP